MGVLVTGAAGFIGFHVSKLLLGRGYEVVGLDNMNDYYDPILKADRLAVLNQHGSFECYVVDLTDKLSVDRVFEAHRPEYVIHLAAQAGVRYSVKNPYAYIDSNVIGFMNVLEACRKYPVNHLIYASSSSVYGGNRTTPFSTRQNVDHPVSLYAATKKANELMAHAYSHIYGIPTTGLRFFTVYGPWGRPDMAYFSFTEAILAGKPIRVFNHGKMERDFTYIDDVVEAVFRLMDRPPSVNPYWDENKDGPGASFAPYKVYNVGNSMPISLMEFITVLEDQLGKVAKKVFVGMQPGDVLRTCADVSDLERDIGYRPSTNIVDGLGEFVRWFTDYYNSK